MRTGAHTDILLALSTLFSSKSALNYPSTGETIKPVRICKLVQDHPMSPPSLLPENKMRHGAE